MLLKQISSGEKARVEIQYSRSVKPEGNPRALEIMQKVYETEDSPWRGLGNIPQSGMKIRETYKDFDAINQIPLQVPESRENPACICGQILKGIKSPKDCPLFRTECNPEKPIGPCMVSTEGTCAAWYKYEE